MTQRTNIGEFEEIVMLTVGILNESAYGFAIKHEIETRLKRTVSMGALHTALYRLEEKGFLNSRMGEMASIRGGKRKRLFTISKSGKQALEKASDKIDTSVTSISGSVTNIEEASVQLNSLFFPIVASIGIIVALQIAIIARRR